MIRVALGLAGVFVGVCLCLGTGPLFWLGLGLMIWGLLQMPTEDMVQDRASRPLLGYRHGHGFGECSGEDCRL